MTPGGPFRYSLLPQFRRDVADLTRRAKQRGLTRELAESLRRIDAFLKHSPRSWGDPLFDARGMYAVVLAGLVDRLRVVYAVHNVEPVVFVRSILPIPGHPLYEEDD